jgi:hypothetical protein
MHRHILISAALAPLEMPRRLALEGGLPPKAFMQY